MLRNLMASTSFGDTILEWIEVAALAIEILAVVIIVAGIFYATAKYFIQSARRHRIEGPYRELKENLARAIMLGLEILVAADIVRTVALEATLQSVAILGLLVLIRIFLSWSLVVEIEERWPWQPKRE